MAISTEQKNAIDQLVQWVKEGEPLMRLAGPAGSGKTTVVKDLVEKLQETHMVQVCATTNKAARVLDKKGIDALTVHQVCMKPMFKSPIDRLASLFDKALDQEDNSKILIPRELLEEYSKADLLSGLDRMRKAGICSALRGLGIEDAFKYLAGWLPKDPQPGIVIIDEASMLGESDLGTVQNVFKKVILVGDEFQLPPVKDRAVFWEVDKCVTLTEIHRQASGSQALDLATKVRLGEAVNLGAPQEIDMSLLKEGCPVIVWTNQTRISITNRVRSKMGREGLPPQVGEYLICRGGDKDAKSRGLINNSMWKVLDADGFVCTLEDDDGNVLKREHVYLDELQKGDGVPFRFAYAITAHSAQGSSWREVMIHKGDAMAYNRMKKEESRRWLYTALTRSENGVIFVK